MTLQVVYTVRRADLLKMYLGSWAAWITVVPGIVCFLFGIGGLTSPKDPVSTDLLFIAFGVFFLLVGPLGLSLVLIRMYGGRLIGTVVHLFVDDVGVWGWPLAADIETTWPKVRRARKLGGVITIPFRQLGTRAGWVPVPERALSQEDREALRRLLTAKASCEVDPRMNR
jgi:hypothetical protein